MMRNLLLSLLAMVCMLSGLATGGWAEEPKAGPKAKGKTIVELAASDPEFSTLVVALQTADLAETLSGPGPFTVFAPTNEAFGKLPKKTLEELFKPKNKKKLVEMLTLHVVAGKVRAADVVKLEKAKTVQGHEAKISTGKNGVRVDGARVVRTDILAKNGVIHVIDSVIVPKD